MLIIIIFLINKFLCFLPGQSNVVGCFRQRVQYRDREYNTANIVPFSTNQIGPTYPNYPKLAVINFNLPREVNKTLPNIYDAAFWGK